MVKVSEEKLKYRYKEKIKVIRENINAIVLMALSLVLTTQSNIKTPRRGKKVIMVRIELSHIWQMNLINLNSPSPYPLPSREGEFNKFPLRCERVIDFPLPLWERVRVRGNINLSHTFT